MSNIKGDLLGGLVVALLSLPMTIPLGALALSPLGPEYMAVGVAAGFQSSIVAGIVSALTGGSRYQISGPRASVSLITAGAVAVVLSRGATAAQALTMAYLVVFLAGFLQILFALAKVGRAVKYIPYPVLAGFMNGVAVLIVLSQLAGALGLPSTMAWSAIWSHRAGISFPSLVVALATIATMGFAPRLIGKVPPIVLAFITGVALDRGLRLLLGDPAVGPLVGPVSGGLPTPGAVVAMLDLHWQGEVSTWLAAEAPTILVLALVGSIESLLSAAAIDAVTGDRHDGNRELIGQGLGNCVCACFGGVASTGAPVRGITSYKAGGRSRLAAVVHSLALLALLLWGKPLLAALPYSVMAGIMIMVAVSMNDTWAFTLARTDRRDFLADCAVVVLVAGITVTANLAVGVFTGVVMTLVLFMLRMSRPVLRRVLDRTEIKSLRHWPIHMEEFLLREGHRIVILEMDGPLFFGTTEQFRDEFERLARRTPNIIILDLRRVRYIDLSGVRVLRQIEQACKQVGCRLFLAGIEEHGLRRNWLLATGITSSIPLSQWFPLLDRALEAAEHELGSAVNWANDEEIPLARLGVLANLTPEDIEHLSGLLRCMRYESGEAIFREGDVGDGLYLLVSGFIEILLPAQDGSFPVRLATFAPGTIFGEMALLAGEPRSADAIALSPSVVYFLPNKDFAAFHHERPTAAVQILLNVGRELSERLRLSNSRVQANA